MRNHNLTIITHQYNLVDLAQKDVGNSPGNFLSALIYLPYDTKYEMLKLTTSRKNVKNGNIGIIIINRATSVGWI